MRIHRCTIHGSLLEIWLYNLQFAELFLVVNTKIFLTIFLIFDGFFPTSKGLVSNGTEAQGSPSELNLSRLMEELNPEPFDRRNF
jgi:hypothetical protein